MGLFRSDPQAEATAEIARLTKREAVLRTRLAASERELGEARSAQRELLVSSDDDESIVEVEGIASDEVRARADLCATLRDALDELGRRRTAAERNLPRSRTARSGRTLPPASQSATARSSRR